jgi:hypothetical protein
MKKGDIVTVRDSSYAKVIEGDELVCGYTSPHNVRDKQGVIIEVNCQFSNPHFYQMQVCTRNDTVIKLFETNKIVFIEERFLKLVKSVREVTMIEVCAQFGEDVKIEKE